MYKFLIIVLILVSPLLEGMASNNADKLESIPDNPNNEFCYNLLQNIDTSQNTFLSAFSIRTALAMVYAGARGNTASQMQKVLYFDSSENFHADFTQTTQAEKKIEHSKLKIANALWVQKNFTLLSSYQNKLQKYYQAEAYKLDFANRTALEKSRQRINNWVENKTEDKIQNLIPEGVLQPTTRLILTNAIYFLGNWQFPFDPKNNFKDTFFATAKSQMAEFMRKELTVNYTETADYQLVQIPYKRNELYLEVVLPQSQSDVAQTLSLLANNQAKLPQPKPTRVEVIMPKFELSRTLNLKKTLRNMGMEAVFGKGADLSGIDGKKDLYLTAVLHKAFVKVNETGTEAAAATAAVVALKSLPPQKEKVFRADHPFLFFIKHRDTETILFSGILQTVE
jgi:serpin B